MSAKQTAVLFVLCLLLGNGAAARTAVAAEVPATASSLEQQDPGPGDPAARLDLWTFDLADLATPADASAGAPAQPDAGAIAFRATRVETGSAAATQPRQTEPGNGRLVYRSLIHGNHEHQATLSRWGLGPQTRFTGFVASAESSDDTSPRAGAEETLRGLLVARTLASPRWADLQLNGGWLSGPAPVHEADPAPSAREANAWLLGGRAAIPQEGLSLSFEYAGTRVRPKQTDLQDGSGEQAERAPVIGQAYAAAAELRRAGDGGAVWRLGTEYRWVGPEFESLANPALPRDHARLRTFAGLGGRDWRIDLRLDRERDNLSRDSTAPTQHRDRAELATSWRPLLPGISDYLGEPKMKLVATVDRRRHGSTAPDAAELDLKRRLRLESEFQREGWRWGIKAANEAVDRGDDGSRDLRTTSLRLYGDLAPARALPVRPALSWRQHEQAGVIDQSWRAELRTRPISLGHGLRANLDLGYLRRWQDDTGDSAARLDLGGSLSWTLQRPSDERRGLALTLSGKAVSGDVAAIASPDYRLTLSLSMHNPLAGW